MQILVTKEIASALHYSLCKHINVNNVAEIQNMNLGSLETVGINCRWRIYRYESGGECFGAHIDAGFPGSGLSDDGSTLLWDDKGLNATSRLTVLIYLNDDFDCGYTRFYSPISESKTAEIIASIKPVAGSVLVFPQAVGEEAVSYARNNWPTHEGSPVSVSSKRAKYVIRTDVLFKTISVEKQSR